MKMLKILGVLMLIGMVASVLLGGKRSNTQNNETITTPVANAENAKLESDRQRDIKNGNAILESRRKEAIYNASKPFEENAYPRMYSKYGKDMMAKVNTMLPKVAESIAGQPDCDQIGYIGISDESNTVNPIFYADCENGKRFKTSVIEIEQGKAPTLETR